MYFPLSRPNPCYRRVLNAPRIGAPKGGSFDHWLSGFCLFSVHVWCCAGMPFLSDAFSFGPCYAPKFQTTMRLRTRSVLSDLRHHTISWKPWCLWFWLKAFDSEDELLNVVWRNFMRIACKFLSELFQQSFPANCLALFLQRPKPPPPKTKNP